MNKISKTFQYGEHSVTLETGHIARQAHGSVLVRMGDAVVLVVVVAKKSGSGQDFFPLTVNYSEKSYAVGKVPGGYFKREGRPTEKETLTSRLIDRPLRPLFPKDFNDEVQITAILLSRDPNVCADIPAMLGASAALCLTGLPFKGPLGGARVGYRDGHYLLNPSLHQLKESQLNLVVAGTRNAVLMVESEADQLSESVMLGAVLFGHENMQVAIHAIREFVEEVGKSTWEWQPSTQDAELTQRVAQIVEEGIGEAYQIADKQTRQNRLASLKELVTSQLCRAEDANSPSDTHVLNIFASIESKIVRQRILSGERRIDGRDTKTIRPITIELGILPRVHGSVLFTRGDTQALATCTLGTKRDAQILDDLELPDTDRTETFILHYNFPPFSVGEVGYMSGPKRREIGHGRLARRALAAIMPGVDQFSYVIRVVSEITESNGSSSMASVCGGSLAMMDAGVPIKAGVAGIAMGLIKEGSSYAILSDILGDEDHLGDMDFKVAGTLLGITALQMDIKIEGITREIMERALEQAKEGRLHILGIMNQAIATPRPSISMHAPSIITMRVSPDKIRDVIGKGGVTIRDITETTGATIDINEVGVINIAAVDRNSGELARRRIEALTAEVEVGKIYEGPIVKLMDFGAFVSLLPGREGMLHISQICDKHIEDIRDYLHEGQVIKVKVIDIDRQGRVRLSMKAITVDSQG